MAPYIIAFRLKEGPTYSARYQSIVSEIQALTETKWDDGTSAFVVWLEGPARAIHDRLRQRSKLHSVDDLLFVAKIDARDSLVSGAGNSGSLEFILKLGEQNRLSATPAPQNALQSKGLFALGSK